MSRRDWTTLLAIDFDKWAARTYAANFPDVEVRCASVADELDQLPDADVILGGPPCQPFSDAGENEGENDERDCIPDFVEAVRRKRPRMFLMENVRGLLKDTHLRYFHNVIESLAACGYVVRWRVLDAAAYGVAQFRKRVFVWGIRNDLAASGVRHCWPERTHVWPPIECAALFGFTPATPTISDAIGVHGFIRRVRGRGLIARGGPRRDIPTSEPSSTITANKGGGGNAFVLIVEGHRAELRVAHRMRLFSMPDDFCWPCDIGKSAQKRIIGNGWASRMGQVFSDAFAAADPGSRTVIDLFCGGGLGAVGWHGRTWTYSPTPALEAAHRARPAPTDPVVPGVGQED